MSTSTVSGLASGRGQSIFSPFWDDLDAVIPDLERVRELVQREAASAGGAIGAALERYVARPGKMLRPAMVVIGSWATGQRSGVDPKTPERILQIAAAIETLHLATLIHDDVIDDADRRRGQPSLHSTYGRKHAVLMGDYLLSRVFSMISEGTERENALRLAAAVGHLIRGEINQNFETEADLFSLRAYLRRIAGKTAVLFGLSLVTGASEAKAKPRETALLARVGYNTGIAFQIIDDILDFTARAESIGKPVAADLRAGIYTLPVIEAVRVEPTLRSRVVPPPKNETVLREAVDAIHAAGGIDRARRRAGMYTDRAMRAIDALANDRQRDVLRSVCERLLVRDY